MDPIKSLELAKMKMDSAKAEYEKVLEKYNYTIPEDERSYQEMCKARDAYGSACVEYDKYLNRPGWGR